jgi:hypothetical protein
VWTFSIVGGGPTGAAGVVVVVVSAGLVVVEAAGRPGRARKRRSLAYGASNPTPGVSLPLEPPSAVSLRETD